jgi:hypothetical protein
LTKYPSPDLRKREDRSEEIPLDVRSVLEEIDELLIVFGQEETGDRRAGALVALAIRAAIESAE